MKTTIIKKQLGLFLLFFAMLGIGQLQASQEAIQNTKLPAVMAASSAAIAANMEIPPGKWELLGRRKVRYGLDRDEIIVTRAEGTFTKLKLRVLKSGINMHRFVVHFGNGGKQEVAVRKNIRAGGETRVIDLKGGKRVIKKVVFWYDTKGIVGKKATVALWGRH